MLIFLFLKSFSPIENIFSYDVFVLNAAYSVLYSQAELLMNNKLRYVFKLANKQVGSIGLSVFRAILFLLSISLN